MRQKCRGQFEVQGGIAHEADWLTAQGELAHSNCITFEMEPVTSIDMAKRIADVQNIGQPWLAALEGDQFVGYAYATQWRSRKAPRTSSNQSL
ncbi:hypothetical protein [Xanthomonas sp. MUS 060]|uniref:GNAT family N-acetyltransferase n=1 Tax=Xanthomonas sp. MUS 060 TaxID=1588031 RepID=UPI000698A8E8|nr:hypothetical protein [Xanthomonas sp. MUS 060]